MVDTSPLLLSPEHRLMYYVFVLALLMMLVLNNRKKINAAFAGISLRSKKRLLVIALLGLILRVAFMRDNAISSVSVWSRRKSAIMISEYHSMNPTLDMKGYDMLLSSIYALTKDIVMSAHILDISMAVISIILIFYLSYILFRDETAALLTSLVIVILPWHIFFSGTHGVEIVASAFIIMSLILISVAGKNRSIDFYFLSFIAILFTALVRKEEIVLLLILLIWFLYRRPPFPKGTASIARAAMYSFMSMILIIPYLVDLTYENFYDNQVSISHIIPNIFALMDIFRYNYLIPILFTAPVLLYALSRKEYHDNREPLSFLLLWAMVISIPFMIHKDMNTRYYIYFAMPAILLITFSISRLRKILSTERFRILTLLLIALIISSSAYVVSACADDPSCQYFKAQPLRVQDNYLPEIYHMFNSSSVGSHLIFIDPQSKSAFQALYRDYPRGNVHSAWIDDKDDREGYLDFMDIRNQSVNLYGAKLYLIEFPRNYENYCSLSYHFERFCTILPYYEKSIYSSQDAYQIYVLTPKEP